MIEIENDYLGRNIKDLSKSIRKVKKKVSSPNFAVCVCIKRMHTHTAKKVK